MLKIKIVSFRFTVIACLIYMRQYRISAILRQMPLHAGPAKILTSLLLRVFLQNLSGRLLQNRIWQTAMISLAKYGNGQAAAMPPTLDINPGVA